MTRHYHVSLLALLGVAVALVWWFARSDDGLSRALETWWASSKAEVASHTPYLNRQDQLTRLVMLERQRRIALERDTSRRRQVYDSALQVALARTALTPDTSVQRVIREGILGESLACQAIVTNCEARVTAARQEAAFEHAGRLVAEARSTRGDSLLAAHPEFQQCRLLHVGPLKINCPSRVTSFKVGAAAGVGVLEIIKLLVTGHL